MLNIILNFILKLVSTETVKSAIGYGINRLLATSGDGVTKDLAKVMIDGIVKSKQNPVPSDAVEDIIKLLGKT